MLVPVAHTSTPTSSSSNTPLITVGTESTTAHGQSTAGDEAVPPAVKASIATATFLLAKAEQAYQKYKMTSAEEYLMHAIGLLNVLDEAYLPLFRQLKAKLLLKLCFVNLDWGDPAQAAIDISHVIELQDLRIDEPTLTRDVLIIRALLCLHQQRTAEAMGLLSAAWDLARDNQEHMTQVSTCLFWAMWQINTAPPAEQNNESPEPTVLELYTALIDEWSAFFRDIQGTADQVWLTIKTFIDNLSTEKLWCFAKDKAPGTSPREMLNVRRDPLSFLQVFWQGILKALMYHSNGPRHLFVSMPLNIDELHQLIGALVQPHCNVTTLEIALSHVSDKISIDGVKMLAAALPRTRLTGLYLRGCNVTDEGLDALATVLPDTQIELLVLNDNAIGDAGLIRLAKQIPSSKLTYLGLNRNVFSDDSLIWLAKQIPSSKLTYLDLNGNAFGDAGLSALTFAITDIRCAMTELKLDLYLGHADAMNAFLSALATSPLTKLALHFRKSNHNTAHDNLDNPPTKPPKVAHTYMHTLVNTLLADTCNINTLTLGGCIDVESFSAFAQALPSLPLTILKFNHLDSRQWIKVLSTALRYSHIKVLDLSTHAFFTESEKKHLLTALTHSPIVELRLHQIYHNNTHGDYMVQITKLLSENQCQQAKKERTLFATLLLSDIIHNETSTDGQSVLDPNAPGYAASSNEPAQDVVLTPPGSPR